MQQAILDRLALSVRNMHEEAAVAAAQDALAAGIDAISAINEGLVLGMTQAGQLYEEGKYFIPELLLCSDALNAGLEILQPHILRDRSTSQGSMVIGVVQGDVHDIGKNLVAVMCEIAGFEVHDLGRDVAPQEFIAKVDEVDADILCLSTLMSTTMDGMSDVVDLLVQENLRERVILMVGGGPVSQSFADRIGADGYAEDAVRAARLAKNLLLQRRSARVSA